MCCGIIPLPGQAGPTATGQTLKHLDAYKVVRSRGDSVDKTLIEDAFKKNTKIQGRATSWTTGASSYQ